MCKNVLNKVVQLDISGKTCSEKCVRWSCSERCPWQDVFGCTCSAAPCLSGRAGDGSLLSERKVQEERHFRVHRSLLHERIEQECLDRQIVRRTGKRRNRRFWGKQKTYRTGQHKTCAELCSGCSSFVKGSAAETHPRRLRPKRSHPGVCSCTKAGLACILCTRTKLFFSCTPPYFPHASCHVNTFCALLAEQNALLDRGGDPHAGRVLERVCKRQEKSITD